MILINISKKVIKLENIITIKINKLENIFHIKLRSLNSNNKFVEKYEKVRT